MFRFWEHEDPERCAAVGKIDRRSSHHGVPAPSPDALLETVDISRVGAVIILGGIGAREHFLGIDALRRTTRDEPEPERIPV